MGKGKYVDFKQVKQQISIVQVLERDGLRSEMRELKGALSGACPIHGGRDRTEFRVNPGKNIYHCFSCEAGGNVLDFVMQMEKVSIRQAALLLQEWFMESGEAKERTPSSDKADSGPVEVRVEVDESEEPNPILSFELKTLKQDCDEVRDLGLSTETVKEFGVGYCSKGLLKGRIAFPFHNEQGELLAYCGRSLEGNGYTFPPKFKPFLEIFNLHRISQEHCGSLYITWDFVDCMKIWDSGVHNVICIPTELVSPVQMETLKRLVDGYEVTKVLDVERNPSAAVLIQELSSMTPIHGVWLSGSLNSLHTCSGEELCRALAV